MEYLGRLRSREYLEPCLWLTLKLHTLKHVRFRLKEAGSGLDPSPSTEKDAFLTVNQFYAKVQIAASLDQQKVTEGILHLKNGQHSSHFPYDFIHFFSSK